MEGHIFFLRTAHILLIKNRTSAPAASDTTGKVEAATPQDGHRQRPAQHGMVGEISTNVYNESDEAGTKRKAVQQKTAGSRRPNPYYCQGPMKTTGAENIYVYDTCLDHYDSPQGLMRASRAYEIPQPKLVDLRSQSMVDTAQAPPTTSETVI